MVAKFFFPALENGLKTGLAWFSSSLGGRFSTLKTKLEAFLERAVAAWKCSLLVQRRVQELSRSTKRQEE